MKVMSKVVLTDVTGAVLSAATKVSLLAAHWVHSWAQRWADWMALPEVAQMEHCLAEKWVVHWAVRSGWRWDRY